MIVINTVDSTRFTYNGITYFKNFTPVVRGDKVEVINTYDSRLRLTDFATDYDQFSVNGTVYASVDLLQQALLPILFTRANLGGGTGTDAFIGLIDTPSSYVGQGGKVTKVNEAENGLEFLEETTQLLNKPVENRYITLAAMLADQANQTTGFLNIVDDPDDEPNSGYYEKLSTSAGVIGDYKKLTADEVAVVENSNEWQIKNINAIQLSFASYVTLIQGRIFLETDNTNITFMIFDAAYTKILEKAVALSGSEDFYFNIYNKTRNTNIRPKWESSAYVDGGTKLRVAVSGFADSEVGVLETLHLGLPINSAGSGVQSVKVSLTAAEFIAIDTTPIEVIPAAGFGKVINVISGIAKLNFNTVAFDADALQICVSSNIDFSGLNGFLYFFNLDSTQNNILKGTENSSPLIVENEAIQIKQLFAAPTLGDGTIDIYINYEIITL